MATSGTVTYDLTQNDIVRDALEKIQAIEAGETPSAEDADKGARELEKMLKHWQARGINIWRKKEALLFLVKAQEQYPLGPNATTNAVDTEDVDQTALSADAVAAATSLTVSSITGIADADRIGILLDSLAFHWTTVNGAPSGSTVVITTGLPSVASSGKPIYAYPTNADLVRPLRVMHCRRRRITSSPETEIPIIIWSHEEYFDTPNKKTEAPPNAVYYDPRRDVGLLYTWPAPESGELILPFTYARPLEISGGVANNPDFPDEWLDAIVYNLAHRLAPDFAVPLDVRKELKQDARELLFEMETWDSEPESIIMVPDLTYGGWSG